MERVIRALSMCVKLYFVITDNSKLVFDCYQKHLSNFTTFPVCKYVTDFFFILFSFIIFYYICFYELI